MADGSRHIMYGVEESTYGETPNNPAFDQIRITGTTLGLARDSIQSNEIRSDRQIADFRLSGDNVAGDINFEASYGSFDQLLEAVLCSADWATDVPAVGTDRIKSGTERRSFTFMRHFSDLLAAQYPYFVYRGCELTTLNLTIAANAMITGSFGVVGKSQELMQDTTALGTPTYNAVSTTTPLDSFTGTLNEGGSSIAVITEIGLTLDNGIAPRFVVGSRQTIRPSIARSNLTGTMTAFFEDASLVNKFINETESSIDFTLPDADGNLMKYTIPRIKYTGGQPDVNGEGPVTLSMPWQALYDATLQSNLAIDRTPV